MAPTLSEMSNRLIEHLTQSRAIRGVRAVIDQTSPKRRRADRRRTAPEGVVTIEYSPDLDGDPDPGEIVWTRVPFEDDPTQGKDRPVVVVGRRGDRLVAVPLTTKRSGREVQVAVGTGAWDSRRRASHARVDRMLDIDPDDMRREGAVLDPRTFERVVAAVGKHHDVHRVSRMVPGTNRDT